MARNITKTAQYKKEYELLFQQLKDSIANYDPCKEDPVWQRAVELGRDKHLPLGEALKIAEQELSEA